MGVAVSMTKEMLREVLYQEIEHYHTDSLSKDGQVSRAPRPSQLLLPAQGDIRPADGLCVRVALCCCRWSRTPARNGMPRPVPRSAPKPFSIRSAGQYCALLLRSRCCALASRSRLAQSDTLRSRGSSGGVAARDGPVALIGVRVCCFCADFASELLRAAV